MTEEIQKVEPLEDPLFQDYIGDIWAPDVHDYCNMKKKYKYPLDETYKDQETGNVIYLRRYAEAKMEPMPSLFRFPFSWAAALGGPLWYVYHGMWKEAIGFDILSHIVAYILFVSYTGIYRLAVAILITFFVFYPIYGLTAMSSLYKRIYKIIDKLHLLRRTPFHIENLSKRLRKAGKPSWGRVIFYCTFRLILWRCIDSIIYVIKIVTK